MATSLYDEHGDRINCAADWLITHMDEWRIGMLPSYQRLCQQVSDNARSIRNLNKPGNNNGSVDVGILTLVDRIGAIMRDSYFEDVTGQQRLKLARYKVNIIRGAAFARHNQRNPEDMFTEQVRRFAS